MTCQPTQPHHSTRELYYSIGVDQTMNFKEKIAAVHGLDSEPMKAAYELDRYVSDPQTRKSPWYWNFYKRVKSAMWGLYPHANDAVRTQMAREFIDDLFHGGYLRALQSLSVPSGANHVSFARDYASNYGVPRAAVLLFGPRGGATMELLHFLAAEKMHGMHRCGTSPHPRCSPETQRRWHNAERSRNWPRMVNDESTEILMDVAEEQRHLPDDGAEALREIWRRHPALRDYAGAHRLGGDIPYQIIEDVLDVLVQRRFSPLHALEQARYSQIVERANSQGVDPFYAVYQDVFADKDQWRPLWNQARRWLYDYALLLWESQNELQRAQGKRVPAEGVVYKPKRATAPTSKKRGVPGTIYLNHGRYYWVVAGKMKPRPLIDPKSKPKVPGTIFKDGNRYYWVVPGLLKRQRLVPKGEKFSAQDRALAESIAYRKWRHIKKKDPQLAAEILRRTRSQGLATKDRALAARVAARMWRQITSQDPQLAARILTDHRPKAKDHWWAQIIVDGKHRFIGSFETRADAKAARARAFQKAFGYPPGYHVQTMPKLDKVWPSWHEEKARLEHMSPQSQMPVIGFRTPTDKLTSLLATMQKVPWLADNIIVVFDDDCPRANADIALQSRGLKWYAEIKNQGKRPVIRGSASLDCQSDRIRIMIFRPGFEEVQVLAEEVYHIGLKILCHASPKTWGIVDRWYDAQLRKGADPTFSLADAFACTMAHAYAGAATTLPRCVVKEAKRLLSPTSDVPTSTMKEVKACWSSPVSG